MGEPMSKLRKRCTGSNLVDMGRSAAHAHLRVGDSDAGRNRRLGGHGEDLRCSRGDAVGAQLGTSLVDRSHGERGNHPGSPDSVSSQDVEGQARCQLMASGWDGVPVVVRAPESGVHGEGGQRVRSSRIGMPGGRW